MLMCIFRRGTKNPVGKKFTYGFMFDDDDERGDFWEWYFVSDLDYKYIYAISVIVNSVIKDEDYLAPCEKLGVDFDSEKSILALVENMGESVEPDDLDPEDPHTDLSLGDWDDCLVQIKIRPEDYFTDEDDKTSLFTALDILKMIRASIKATSNLLPCIEKMSVVSEKNGSFYFDVNSKLLEFHGHKNICQASVVNIKTRCGNMKQSFPEQRKLTLSDIVSLIMTTEKTDDNLENVQMSFSNDGVIFSPTWSDGGEASTSVGAATREIEVE